MRKKILLLFFSLFSFFTFPSFADTVSNVQLSENGIVSWKYDGEENTIFEIKLSRNGNLIGCGHHTYLNIFDLNPLMNKEGYYYAQVTPIGGNFDNSDTRCSGYIYISEETALDNKRSYELSRGNTQENDIGWCTENGNKVYRMNDGTKIQGYYTMENKIKYYFNEEGCFAYAEYGNEGI